MHNCPHCGYSLKASEPFEYGNVRINEAGEIVYHGQVLPLYPSSRMLVGAIIRSQGRPLTRDALLNIIDCNGSDRSIDTYFARARAIFRNIDPSFNQIKAMRDTGYKWNFQEKSNVVEMKPHISEPQYERLQNVA